MLATAYTHNTYRDGNWIVSELTKISTGEVKVFRLIGKSLDGVTQHMESMTDDNCQPYFKEVRK